MVAHLLGKVEHLADVDAFPDTSLYTALHLLELCHDGCELLLQRLIGKDALGSEIDLVAHKNHRNIDAQRSEERKPERGYAIERGGGRDGVDEDNDL